LKRPCRGGGQGDPAPPSHGRRPADRAQWKTDPFTPTIQATSCGARLDGHEGTGRRAAAAFLTLKRQNVPRTRDVILMAEPTRKWRRPRGRWMIANHYAEIDPEYVIDEGGFGSTDLFAPKQDGLRDFRWPRRRSCG